MVSSLVLALLLPAQAAGDPDDMTRPALPSMPPAAAADADPGDVATLQRLESHL